MAILSAEEYQEIAQNLVFAAKLQNFRGVVYCEAEADKYFWQKIFDYKTSGKFDFHAYTKSTNDTKMRGSGQVNQFINFVNTDFRICVDSDYYAQTGDFRYNKPFITETQTYSIENHWCCAGTIKPFLERKYSVTINFDFPHFFRYFSEIIYKSFVYTVLDKKNKTSHFTIEEFSKIISYGNFVPKKTNITMQEKADEYLAYVAVILDKKNKSVDRYFDTTTVDTFQTEFFKNKAQTYLLIQGHTLYDKVIKLILADLKEEIKRAKFAVLPNSEKANFDNSIKNFTDLSRNFHEKSGSIVQLLASIDI